MSFEPFYVGTCEAKSNNEIFTPFTPPLNEPLAYFPIQDPFGLRKAIVPIFKRGLMGNIFGMGTAFHIDGWGTFLTADHVIDFARENYEFSSGWKSLYPISTRDHPILFLGMGLIYGLVTIPDEAFSSVEHIIQVMREKDDPLAILKGQKRLENAMDLAVMSAVFKSKAESPHCVPVKASGWIPSIGDNDLPGVSFATCFSLIPEFSKLTPTIDTHNPMWRCGWAVLKRKPWGMAGLEVKLKLKLKNY